MADFRFRKTNHQAIIGFLLPFVAASAASLSVLYTEGRLEHLVSRILFLSIIPLILLTGLIVSIRSISRIKDLGDRDYAYSGLVLNLFFILLYLGSLAYIFWLVP